MSELQRASVMAIKEESTLGTLTPPTAATDYIPMRQGGDEMTPELEILDNDELYNSIGATAKQTGKENPTASHTAYLKHSGVAGQAPNWALILKSCLGASKTRSATDAVVAGTSATKAVVASGAGYEVGEALLVKASNGTHFIRNIASKNTNDLNYNFVSIDAADASVIEKNYMLKPASSGHPSFSNWIYNGNGGLIQALAGCRTNSASLEFTAGQQVECSYDMLGTSYFFNPIEITASSKYLDVTDSSSTIAVSVEEKFYKTPIMLAEAIQAALNTASVDVFTVSYSSTTGKFTIASDGTSLSLLWSTGTNTANTIGTKIGFAVAADDTGSLAYTSDNAQVYTAPHSPDFDDVDNIVVKANELFIGSAIDNVCMKAATATVSIDNETADIDSICSESGLMERIITARSVTFSCEVVYEKHQAKFVDALLQNKSVSIMLNVGPKSGGNWVPGKCVNIYIPNAKVTSSPIGGDDAITMSLEFSAFVSDSSEDIYINFV